MILLVAPALNEGLQLIFQIGRSAVRRAAVSDNSQRNPAPTARGTLRNIATWLATSCFETAAGFASSARNDRSKGNCQNY